MKKMLLLTLGTSVLSALVISNAYATKGQFYTTIVYLLNSNRTLAVLYLQAAMLVWVATTMVKRLFFGTLRAAEVEHLVERSWYAVLETFILLAGFHQDLQLAFVGSITLLFVMKAFHWLTEERIDYMERSPLITWTFHLRAVTFLLLLLAADCLYVCHSWNSLKARGASVQIVFGLEYAIMFLVAVNTFCRYLLHSIDLRSEDPWENKAIYMRYVDIFIGFFKLLLYVGYMAFMLWILFIPLHIVRRIYVTAKNFQKSVQDVVSSHQAIRNLNTLYADATEEDLQAVNTVCVICREEMVQRCKKLPCGHIFHTTCLHSWFQRQQVCPTCRMDVLSQRRVAQNARQQHLRPPQPPQGGGLRGPPGGGPPGMPQQPAGLFHPMMPPPQMWPPPGMGPLPPPPAGPPPPPPTGPPPPPPVGREGLAPQPPPHLPPRQGEPGQDTPPPPPPPLLPMNGVPPMAGFPPGGFPPFFPPPFMMPPPFGMAPGFAGIPSPDSLQHLSDDDLRSLEGMERANMEARIAFLRSTQQLLDSAVARLAQYSAIMTTMGSAAGPGFPGYPYPPSFAAAATNTSLQTETSPDATTTTSPPLPPPSPPREREGNLPRVPLSGGASVQRQLLEGERNFSFTAANLGEGQGEGEGEGGRRGEERAVVSGGGGGGGNGESVVFSVGGREEGGEGERSSPAHVGELRQRRIQRFHSIPTTPTRDSSAVEEEAVGHGGEGGGEGGGGGGGGGGGSDGEGGSNDELPAEGQ